MEATKANKIALLQYLLEEVQEQIDFKYPYVNGTCGMVLRFCNPRELCVEYPLELWYRKQRPSYLKHRRFYNKFLKNFKGIRYAYWFADSNAGNVMRIEFLNYLIKKVNKLKE